MAESALSVIFQMVSLLIETTIVTLTKIIGLFGKLLESLGVVASVGGPLGFAFSVFIVTVVGYFITRLFFGGGKRLIILIPLGVLLAYLLLLSTLV